MCTVIVAQEKLEDHAAVIPPSLLSSPGAEAGAEGNQRTAGPSFPFHELLEAGGGCPCPPVLPRSR